jgi:hypothetical protein
LCCFLKQQERPQVHNTNDLEERDRQVWMTILKQQLISSFS